MNVRRVFLFTIFLCVLIGFVPVHLRLIFFVKSAKFLLAYPKIPHTLVCAERYMSPDPVMTGFVSPRPLDLFLERNGVQPEPQDHKITRENYKLT